MLFLLDIVLRIQVTLFSGLTGKTEKSTGQTNELGKREQSF